MARFILDWIPKMDNKHSSQERLVRALAVSNISIDGEVLMKLFDDPASSFYLKWAIGNTIASAKVDGVNGWLKKKFMALTLGKENEMLVYAIGKYLDYTEAIKILRKIVDVYPLHVATVLSRIGKKEDLDFLKERIKHFKSAPKAAIAKAIKKLGENIRNNYLKRRNLLIVDHRIHAKFGSNI
jgi:hypothetical protein